MTDITVDADLYVEDGANRRRLNVDDFDKSLIFEQSAPSDTWVIVHELGKYPSVTVIDSGGHEVIGDVAYDSLEQVTLTFSTAFGGKATLN